MCHPTIYDCWPHHFPLLVNAAMERFGREVNLGMDAVKVLKAHGNANKTAFEAALRPEKQEDLNRLSEGLHQRLESALKQSPQTDGNGQRYHPERISGKALADTLEKHPLLP
jgi:hypothetical protein